MASVCSYTALATSSDLGTRRHRIVDHALEHVRGDDDGPAHAQTGLDHSPLNNGQLLIRTFDPQIAPRHHDAVRFADDFIEIDDRFLTFNLGDDERPTGRVFDHCFELQNILGFPHEGEGNVIDAHFEAHRDVGQVLGGESRQADFDARQVDVAPAAQFAGREHFALDSVVQLGQDSHLDFTVVQ